MKPNAIMTFILVFLFAISFSSIIGQNVEPRKQWQYNPARNGIDKLNKIIQCANNTYIAVGHSEILSSSVLYKQPTVARINADGSLNSITYFNDGDFTLEGEFFDVIEIDGGFVAVGIKVNGATGNEGVFLVEFNEYLNILSSHWYTENTLFNFAIDQPDQHLGGEVQIKQLPFPFGYILCTSAIENGATIPAGSDEYSIMRGAILIRLDINFLTTVSASNFGSHSGGWEIYKGEQNGNSDFAAHGKDVCANFNGAGFPDGFLLIGSIKETPSSVLNRDVLVIKVDNLGDILSPNSFIIQLSEISLGGSYSDNGPDDATCYSSSPTENETDDERGNSIELISNGGNILISAYFDWFKYNSSNCPSISYSSSFVDYYDSDMAVIEIDQTGNLVWTKNIEHHSGVNWRFDCKRNQNGDILISCNKLLPTSSFYNVFKYDNSGNYIWNRQFKGSETSINSISGSTVTSDDGIVVAGFNDLNNTDFHAIKLRSNCQMVLSTIPSYWQIANGQDILTNVTWSSNMNVKGEIKIKSGASLTINSNSIISLASTNELNDYDYLALNNFTVPNDGNSTPTGIIVEPGGLLIIRDASSLKGITDCGRDFMWDGIQVHGNSGLPQKPETNQGVLNLSNFSQILNARIGTLVGNAIFGADGKIIGNNLGGGGIVVVNSDAEYLNCQKSVQFEPYTDPVNPNINRSRFYDTYFSSTLQVVELDYSPPLYNSNFVELDNVHGVTFEGVIFNGVGTGQRDTGNGIYSFNSTFYVGRRHDWLDQYGHPAGKRSEFHNLIQGVLANTQSSTNTFSIIGCIFDNNSTALGSDNYSFFSFLRNQVHIRSLFGFNGLPIGLSSGISMTNATGYRIEENDFIGYINPDPVVADFQDMYGILPIKWNINTDLDIIYKNNFNGLEFASSSAGLNAGTGIATEGLKLYCNNFWDNVFDIHVFDVPFWPGYIFGISSEQGTVNNPASNQFDLCSLVPEHIANYSPTPVIIEYYYCNIGDVTDPEFCTVQTNTYDLLFPWDPEVWCPSRIDVGSPHGERLQMNQNLSNKDSLESILNQGNSTDLLNILNSASVGTIKDSLLAHSPYLSDTLLTGTLNSVVLGDYDIAEIILANSVDTGVVQPNTLYPGQNIDSANTVVVIDQIIGSNLVQPLKDSLLAAQNGRSAKHDLISKIGFEKSERIRHLNNLISYYLLDSIGTSNLDSIIFLLDSDFESVRYKQLVIDIYLEKNEFLLASNNLAYFLDLDGYENYYSLMTYLIYLKSNNLHISNIKSDLLMTNLVDSLATDSSQFGSGMARSIMTHVFGKQYPFTLLNSGQSFYLPQRVSAGEISEVKSIERNYISASPNPFLNQLTFSFDLEDDKIYTLKILSLTGKQILEHEIISSQKILTLEELNLSPGIYFGYLYNHSELIGAIKLICVN